MFVNVAGGVRIDEPGADLAVALAIASAARRQPVRDGLAAFGEIGLTGRLRPADAGRAPAGGVREARSRHGVVAGRNERRRGKTCATRRRTTLRQAIESGARCSRERRTTKREGWAPEVGVPRTRAELDLRRDPTCSRRSRRSRPGTDLRQGIDDIIRSQEGALIVVGEPDELSFLYSGGMRLDLPFTPQLLYELAKMDGAIIVRRRSLAARVRERPADARPDDPLDRDRHAAPHRRARREADRRARDLDLAAARDRDALPRPPPLPARADRGRAREDEPGAGDARDLPAAARPGADAPDRARVPERGHARRRPRRPPARRDDDADGRGDRARLRRARHRGPADPHAARGARRRGAAREGGRLFDYHAEDGAGRDPRGPRGRSSRARLPGPARLRAARGARLPARRQPARPLASRRAATASSPTSRGCRTA